MDPTILTILITVAATIASSLITWVVSKHYYSKSKSDSTNALEDLGESLQRISNMIAPGKRLEPEQVAADAGETALVEDSGAMEKITEMIRSYAHENPIGGIEHIQSDLKKVLEWLEQYCHWRIGRGD